MDDVQIVVLVNGTIIISRIVATVSELGEPDCKLINPYQILDENLTPWLYEVATNLDTVMISSDKILTLVDPKETILNEYLNLTK